MLNAYALFFGALLAIGPVVGGLLTSLSWRWIFLINVPIGIAAIAITWKMIPNVRHDLSTKMPDPIGSLTAILTIGAISFGLLNGHTWGWGDGRIIASWVVAVVAAVVFVVSTRRAAVPVIEPQMFRSRVFSAANVSVVIAATIFGMQLLGMSLFLQRRTQLRRGHPPGLVPDRHRLRLLAPDDHRLSDYRPTSKAQRDGQYRSQQRPPDRRCLRHRHPRPDPRQRSHDRRPDAVLPLVVGSGRRLRRCRPDLPRPHPPSPDRGREGGCR